MKSADFYADPARRDSEEIEYGRQWIDSQGNGPYEVNWLVETGEVFAFFFGTVDRESVDDVLDGWPEMEGAKGGFAWLSERLTRAPG